MKYPKTHKILIVLSVIMFTKTYADDYKTKLKSNVNYYEKDSTKTPTENCKKNNFRFIKKTDCNSKSSKNYMACVPFAYKNRIINLKANINGGDKEFDFVLDSGAPTFITDSVLNASSLEFLNTAEAHDANNNQMQVSSYRISSLNISGKNIKNIEASNSSFVQNMAVLKGRANGGLLGANAMKNAIWMINFKNKQIKITDNINLLNITSNAFETKMGTDANGCPVIDVNIGLKHKHTFVIDLAYNGSVLLPAKYFKKSIFNDSLSFTKNEKLSTGFASDIKQNSYYFLKKFEFGTLSTENIKSSSSGKNTRSLIGNEFLENYIVVLDFIHGKFILIPYSDES